MCNETVKGFSNPVLKVGNGQSATSFFLLTAFCVLPTDQYLEPSSPCTRRVI